MVLKILYWQLVLFKVQLLELKLLYIQNPEKIAANIISKMIEFLMYVNNNGIPGPKNAS